MSISLDEDKHYQIVRVEGDFDSAVATKAREVFVSLLDRVDKNIKVDMSKVTFIDSSGIGALVFLYKRLRANGYEMILDGLQQQPYEIIQLLRMDQIIETHKLNKSS